MAKTPRTPATASGNRGTDTAVLDSRDGTGADLESADLEDGAEAAERPVPSGQRPSLKDTEEDDRSPGLPFVGEGADDIRSRITARLARTSRGLPVLDADGEPEPVDEDEEDQQPITSRIVKPGETIEEDDGEDDGEGTAPAASATAAPDAKKYIEIPDDGVVRLTVRGETVEMTGADFKANAQKLTAADGYFNEAKALIEEARRLRAPGGQPAATDQSTRAVEPPLPPAPTQRQWDRDKLAAIIDKWQTGEPQEGVDDLIAILDEAAATNAPDQEALIRTVQQVYEARSLTDAVQNELSRAASVLVADEFKPLREHPNLYLREQIPNMIWDNTMRQIAVGLKSIGIPDEELAKPGLTQGELIRGYVHFARQPAYAAKLKPIPELASQVTTGILREFFPQKGPRPTGSQPPSPGSTPPPESTVRLSEARIERKRTLVPQPHATAMRTDASKSARRRLSTSEQIEQIRQQRQQGVVPVAGR